MDKLLKALKNPKLLAAIAAVLVTAGLVEASTAEGWVGVLSELATQISQINAE